MVSVRLYVEGGGDSKALRTECRRGFSEFARNAGLVGRMPKVVACGGRQNAYDSFRTALEACPNDGTPMLLVDAEEPVGGTGSWEHVKSRDGWERPRGATDEQCHLMVQCMEAWFLADRPALRDYFGKDFAESALPGNPQVEQIPKTDVLNGLAHAARHTTKGAYVKGQHSFDILARINPSVVESAAPHAKRFLGALRAPAEPA